MLKENLIRVFGSSLFSRVSLALYNKKPLVVLYHGVTNGNSKHGIQNYRHKHVKKETFEKQIDWLSSYFSIVPLSTIEELSLSKRPPSQNLCAITFDDGYRNNFLNAYPILKKRNLPATIFVTTGFIDRNIALWPDMLEEIIGTVAESTLTVPWSEHDKKYSLTSREERVSADKIIRSKLKKVSDSEREKLLVYLKEKSGVTTETVLTQDDYAPLVWEEVVEMSKNNISIGAHTETHPILSRLSKEKQKEEISLSIEKIRNKIGDCKQFAYPNGQPGDFNKDTKEILTSFSIQTAWTTEGSRVDTKNDGLLALPRITLDNTENESRFRGLTSNSLPSLRKLTKNFI